MRWRGWVRLWIVLSLLFVVIAAVIDMNDNQRTWDKLDHIEIEQCVSAEEYTHEDGLKCAHRQGADQTLFQHEHTTPAAWWTQEFGAWLLVDLLATAGLLAIVSVVGWVVRGFRKPA